MKTFSRRHRFQSAAIGKHNYSKSGSELVPQWISRIIMEIDRPFDANRPIYPYPGV